MTQPEKPISGKELANELKHHPGFISAMKKAGYQPFSPPNLHLLSHAKRWLDDNPHFRTTRAYPCKARRKAAPKTDSTAERMAALNAAAVLSCSKDVAKS